MKHTLFRRFLIIYIFIGIIGLIITEAGGFYLVENHLEDLVSTSLKNGANIIILSDRGVDENHVAIPSLLAVSALEHYLVRTKKRTAVSVILESAEPRDVHHFATLLGYGAQAINPYLAQECVEELVTLGLLGDALPDSILQLPAVETPQVDLLPAVKAALQLTVRRHPDPAAVGTEVVAHRGDQADGARSPRQAVPPGHAAGLQFL